MKQSAQCLILCLMLMIVSIIRVLTHMRLKLAVICLICLISSMNADAAYYQAYGRISMYVDQTQGNKRMWSSIIKIKNMSNNVYLNCFPADDTQWGAIFDGDLSQVNIGSSTGVNLIFWDAPGNEDSDYVSAYLKTLNTVHRIGRLLQDQGNDVQLYWYLFNPIDMLKTGWNFPAIGISTDGYDKTRQNKLKANKALLNKNCDPPWEDCIVTMTTEKNTCAGSWFAFPASFADNSFRFSANAEGAFFYANQTDNGGAWMVPDVSPGLYEILVKYPAVQEPLNTAVYIIGTFDTTWTKQNLTKDFVRTLDQGSLPANIWHSLGYFDITDYTSISVMLTQDASQGKSVVYDAIKIIKLKD